MKVASFILLVFTFMGHGYALAAGVETEGNWRGSGGAAASMSSGNTRNDSVKFNVDAARETSGDKLSLYVQMLRSHSVAGGVNSTTANQWKIGSRYDNNISEVTFGFGGLDFNSDELISLSMRSAVSGGLGYHLIKMSENKFDLFGGVSYRADRYSGVGVLVYNKMETKFSTKELLLGEESTHKLTENTTFKQRLAINSNLGRSKGYRATFDASLLVSINKTMSLTVSLQDRYDSLAQAPVQRNDFMLFTGVNVKFGG